MVATEPVATTFRSPFADIDIPEVPLAAFVLSRAQELGSKPALIEASSGRQVTCAQLADVVRRASFGLHQRGFAKGDVLALFTPNVPEFAVAYYAVASLGGTLTTINPLASADELATQLADSGARWMITAPSCLETALRARGKLEVERVFVFGEATGGAQPFDALLSAEGPVPQVPIEVQSDVVALPYSSGTTGLPKGVMLTHYNLVANLRQMDGIAPVSERDTVIAVLPFFHIYGMEVILHHGLSKGATLILMSRFELEPFLAALERHSVSCAYLVPPIVLALAKHPLVEQSDLSSLRTIVCAAAPLDAELARACEQRIDCEIRQAYGLTECSPITHFVPEGRNKSGSVGPVVRSTEAKIVHVSTGEPLGPGARGQVCIRGPQIMRGYLHRPEATAAMIDADGWLHSGDIGYADDEGYFYIVDRVKELIKYKAYQVAPAELEAVLLAHPSVIDAAVVGSPDDEAGEVPKAFLVLKSDDVQVDDILEFVAERVAPYKKIRRWEIVAQIPKTASGKILRRRLAEQERARLVSGTVRTGGSHVRVP
jgi:acyl-CoA synthetase (AMP-forming)/AMP-acid ligase II